MGLLFAGAIMPREGAPACVTHRIGLIWAILMRGLSAVAPAQIAFGRAFGMPDWFYDQCTQ